MRCFLTFLTIATPLPLQSLQPGCRPPLMARFDRVFGTLWSSRGARV